MVTQLLLFCWSSAWGGLSLYPAPGLSQATEGFDEKKSQLCAALRDEAMDIDNPSRLASCAHFGAFTAHVGAIPAKLMRPDFELPHLHSYLESQVRRFSEDAAWCAAETRARCNVEREVGRGSTADTARADAKAETAAAIERYLL